MRSRWTAAVGPWPMWWRPADAVHEQRRGVPVSAGLYSPVPAKVGGSHTAAGRLRPLVLVVEDEHGIAELLAVNLRHEGFEVMHAGTAEAAASAVDKALPALVLLDWMLPGQSGVDLLRRWRQRERTRDLPVIMLTARAQEGDRVQGLELGADDYVAKPFSTRELMARIRSVLRRKAPDEALQPMAVGGVMLQPASREAFVAGRPLRLGPIEFRLLQVLMAQPDRVYSRAQLLDKVWGDHVEVEDRTVDAQVKRLRDALETAGAQACVQTVRGMGYRFDAVAAENLTPGAA